MVSDHQPTLPEKKKQGRPKGSKDKPRQGTSHGAVRERLEPAQTTQAVITAEVDGELH